MRVDSVKLNSHQKTVLAIIADAPTSKVAAGDISNNPNLNQGALLLQKLGIINYSNTDASITDAGVQVSQEENITDETGMLTTNGTMFLKMNATNGKPQATEETPPVVGESLLHQLVKILTN